MAINPIILQSKANLYTPNVRISETELLGYDGDPTLAVDGGSTGQTALVNAAVSSFYSDSTGNLYLKTAAGWQALSTSDVSINPYCQIVDVEVLEPLGDELVLIRNVAEVNDPGVTEIITEATKVRLKIAWDRLNEPALGYVNAVPLINGVPLPFENIDSVNLYDKVQTGFIDYDIIDGSIELTFGAEQITIVVTEAVKPTADITYTLPMLPWDLATEQTAYKENDDITINIENASEELDAIRITGGVDSNDVFDAAISDVLTGIDDVTPGTYTATVPAVVSNGTDKKFSVQVRSKATRAWSLLTDFTAIEADTTVPSTTVNHTYPANQMSLKDFEIVTIDGTVNKFDSATYVATPSAEWDGNAVDFVATPATNTWTIDVATSDLSSSTYRYEEQIAGVVTYRLNNGRETTYDIKFHVSNTTPQVVSFDKVVVQTGATQTLVVTFDQPPLNYTGSSIENSRPIASETVDLAAKTITYTIDRLASFTPSINDLVIADMAGPSNMGAPVTLTNTDAIKYNGFVQQTNTIPSGIRTGNVPIQVDLTTYQGTFTFSWDATDTVTLTPTFDAGLSGTVTADTLVLLTQNANGTLDFEILYSDVTILQTTYRITHNDTHS